MKSVPHSRTSSVLDHILAKNKGGTSHIDNLQLLCGNCNKIKGDRGMEYLQHRLSEHSKKLMRIVN